MINILPGPVRGLMSISLYALNTIVWVTPLFVFALFKLIIPVRTWRRICDQALNWFATSWIGVNNYNQNLFSGIKWDIQIADRLKKDVWYLVLANHQSWVDILVLQRIFHRKIPFLKFFLKKELFWVPVLGLAWWALDFPFMKRYSKSFLEKHPHRVGKDIEITRKACEKFKSIPISVMSFVEGTRFTRAKHDAQNSPYNHLLKTKAGGIALVLAAMGEQMHRILDVTIVYPNGTNSFWAFVCGKVGEIRVRVKARPITSELRGDYFRDAAYRTWLHNWLNDLWAEKDRCIDLIRQQPRHDCGYG
jgi:1-acyl-sn-glycerol-3-phosphate acyltransferase